MTGTGRFTRLMMALTMMVLFVVANASGQSLIAGDIVGTVMDPSQAALAGAHVTLKNLQTGQTQSTTTNSSGAYRFSLLKPGQYQVSVDQSGFAPVNQRTTVQVGQTTTTNFALQVAKSNETIEVTEAAPVISPDASQSTSYSQIEVQNLPNAGGDITNIAETAPGVVLNSTGGYGNFTVNGMPATSNLFTVNGENDMDPYFNINNTGATNLTLGSNEIQEATVVANPYSGQYGQLSGAQVSYVTKSGSNNFHGIAQWLWNGRALNANDYMTKRVQQSEGENKVPFSNANQWAVAVGGPIVKNNTFFFADYEGMHFVLPNTFNIIAPSPAFAAATLANVGNVAPNELSAYQTMFGLYSKLPGYAGAQAFANNDTCNALTTLPGFDPTTQNCAVAFNRTATALAKEWIFSGRLDQKLGNADNIFFRYKADHGLQPTTIDAINSNFNALSNQPSWDSQVQETHVFGAKATNAFTASLSHYVAQFQQNAALVQSTFPYRVIFDGSIMNFTGFNAQTSFPQGRNVTQYQFIDDYTINAGKHNLKFGGNFRRYDVSDHNFFFNNPGVYFGYVANGLNEFVNGLGFQYRKTYNAYSDVPIAMWGLGVYGQDEIKVSKSLSLTFALRAERNSNPVCQINCFANFKGPWNSLPSVQAGANAGNVPYTQDIVSGLHQAYPGVDKIDLSPRISFSWSPLGSNRTVLSGGFGIFYDSPPAGLVDDLLGNPPISAGLRVRPAAGTPVFDTTANGSAAVYQQSANAFTSGFAAGQTYSQIKANLAALGVSFSAPAVTAITGTMHAPRWTEWNLQLQQAIGANNALIMNYVGNHGEQIPYANSWFNATDPFGVFNGLFPATSAGQVPNYSNVTYVKSGAISNYDGLTVTFRRTFSKWFSGHLNYTWSHNLDEVSNGGIFTYGDSILGQNNPASLRAGNYGNSDYDIRHNLNGDFLVSPTFKSGNGFVNELIGGWQWAGKLFWRSGLPFSVVDGINNGGIQNGGGTILAQPTGGTIQGSCGRADANPLGDSGIPSCLNPVNFVDHSTTSYDAFSTQKRNQYRGPGFFDMDMALYKNFKMGERVNFGLGAQAFNVFNHPNFGNPDNNFGSSTFGQITSMTGVPTSPYGNFLGFDSSPRVLQLSVKLTF